MKVDERAERLAPWLGALLVALPIVCFRYPPMSDLTHHEGMIGVLRHFTDPKLVPPGLYVLNIGHGNQLFHLAALALSYALPTDVACKTVVAAAIVANVVFAGELAAHLGASRWTALLVVPVTVGWLFFMGFAHDLIGLALMMAALPALDRYGESPTPRGLLGMTGWILALHFAHESGMVVFCGAVLVFAAGYRFEPRATALRVAPFFLGLFVAVGDIVWMKPLKGASVAAVPSLFIPVGRKLQTIPVILFGRYEGWLLYPLFAMVVTATVLLAVERARAEPAPIPRAPLAFARRYRFELFAAASFLGFLAFPTTLNGATLVYQRFLAPAYVVAVIASAPRKQAVMGAAPRVLASLVPVLTLAALWPVLQDSSATHAALDTLYPLVQPGGSVVLVDLDGVDPARVYLPAGAAARVLAERGGRLMPTFTESPNAPVITNPAERWNEPAIRLLAGAGGFFPAHDFHRFRYAFVHTKFDGNAAVAVEALAPEAKLLGAAGEFLLFESKLDVVPVVSPDVPMENPAPATLLHRMRSIAAKLRAPTPARPSESPAPPPQ